MLMFYYKFFCKMVSPEAAQSQETSQVIPEKPATIDVSESQRTISIEESEHRVNPLKKTEPHAVGSYRTVEVNSNVSQSIDENLLQHIESLKAKQERILKDSYERPEFLFDN